MGQNHMKQNHPQEYLNVEIPSIPNINYAIKIHKFIQNLDIKNRGGENSNVFEALHVAVDQLQDLTGSSPKKILLFTNCSFEGVEDEAKQAEKANEKIPTAISKNKDKLNNILLASKYKKIKIEGFVDQKMTNNQENQENQPNKDQDILIIEDEDDEDDEIEVKKKIQDPSPSEISDLKTKNFKILEEICSNSGSQVQEIEKFPEIFLFSPENSIKFSKQVKQVATFTGNLELASHIRIPVSSFKRTEKPSETPVFPKSILRYIKKDSLVKKQTPNPEQTTEDEILPSVGLSLKLEQNPSLFEKDPRIYGTVKRSFKIKLASNPDIEISPGNVEKVYHVGVSKVIPANDETLKYQSQNMRDSERSLRILGFFSRTAFEKSGFARSWLLEPVQDVLPQPGNNNGANKQMSAFVVSMLKNQKVAIARFVRAKNVDPVLVV